VGLEISKKTALFEAAFGSGYMETGKVNFHVSCPSCKDGRKNKKKLYIELATGWYHCWVCGTSGKNINFLFRKFAKNYAPRCAQLFHEDRSYTDQQALEEIILPPELPEDSVLLMSAKNDPDANDVKRYLKARGLTKMDMYRWRICVSNEFKFRRKAIFPSFTASGQLNYYTARCIDETKFKYKNADVPKRTVIFNEFDINWDEPIILVEGVFDAVKCPENTVPVLGSSLASGSNLFMRLKQHESTVIVAFDEDAESRIHDVCRRLSLAGCSVYNLTIKGNDLGSRTKSDVRDILATTARWTPVSFLNHKISKIKSGSIL
jgi:DNA primase